MERHNRWWGIDYLIFKMSRKRVKKIELQWFFVLIKLAYCGLDRYFKSCLEFSGFPVEFIYKIDGSWRNAKVPQSFISMVSSNAEYMYNGIVDYSRTSNVRHSVFSFDNFRSISTFITLSNTTTKIITLRTSIHTRCIESDFLFTSFTILLGGSKTFFTIRMAFLT